MPLPFLCIFKEIESVSLKKRVKWVGVIKDQMCEPKANFIFSDPYHFCAFLKRYLSNPRGFRVPSLHPVLL